MKKALAADAEALAEVTRRVAVMWAYAIARPESLILVAREGGTGFVVGYAQWVLPRNKREGPQKPAACHGADWGAAPNVHPRRKKGLLVEFGDCSADLRQGVSRTAGAGTLTPSARWPMGEADHEGFIGSLFTDVRGKAKVLYERLGFGETSRFVLEMEAFGGTGKHIKIAMG
ncbi:hypothetical protein SCAR479_07372 [Seiridium cardinale]|uniref:GNAT family N-acetyltransferase n=1 Tax=Seiridium cardinale TaxID=138064 RepID=A0ABR2XQ11_9PEZI